MLSNSYRFIYMILLGIGISILFRFVIFRDFAQHGYWVDMLFSCGLTVLIWEGNLRLDQYLNQRVPWQTKTRKRLLLQGALVLTLNSVILFSAMNGFHQVLCITNKISDSLLQHSMIIALSISITILTIEIGMQFFINWKNSLIEVEQYKALSAQAQLQNLKNQINPHFLFNNLSVLTSLVYSDTDKAAHFIQELSKVYRYVLEQRNTELVTLQDELQFLHHYMYLLKIRFEEGVVFHLQIHPDSLALLLPPICLQMIVENAIKHNEVNALKPLYVFIETGKDKLIVRNVLQLRPSEEPTMGTGLQNIKARYAYFTDRIVSVQQTTQEFIVELPLIASS